MKEAMRERERTRASEEKKERLGLEMKRTGLACFYTDVNRIGSWKPVWFTSKLHVSR
jgi:hypothetical protein